MVQNIYTKVEECVVRQAVRVSHTSSWQKLDANLRTRIQELSCLPLEHSYVIRQSRSTSGSRNLDLRQVKLAIQQHSRRTQSTDSHIKKTHTVKNTKPIPEPIPRPRTWPAQTQIKTKIISSSDSSRTSSPALKNLNKKKDDLTKTKNNTKSVENVTSTKPQMNIATRKKPEIQPTISKIEKNKPKKQIQTSTFTRNQNSAQQKSKFGNNISNNKKPTTEKSQPPKSVSVVNKENCNSTKQSVSGSSSSTQQSPLMINKKKLSNSSNNSSTPNSQTAYSSSPSLRRSLLLAAKAPQVPVKPMSPATNKRIARIQASNSLTSPTKSSAAKCVNNNTRNKVTKQTTSNKNTTNKNVGKVTVGRSGTFLKDEPTVLNKN